MFHKEKCHINAINERGDTPLHLAARWNYGIQYICPFLKLFVHLLSYLSIHSAICPFNI